MIYTSRAEARGCVNHIENDTDVTNLYHGHVLIRVLIIVLYIYRLNGCKDLVKICR